MNFFQGRNAKNNMSEVKNVESKNIESAINAASIYSFTTLRE